MVKQIPLGNPQDIKPYSTFFRPAAIPETAHDEGDLICVRYNQEWRGYILGALEALRWRDAWKGSKAEIDATIDNVERLYMAVMSGDCTDMSSIYDLRVTDCGLEVQRVEAGEWILIGDFSECGAVGPEGPTGPVGPAGPEGPPGDCTDCQEAVSPEGLTETTPIVSDESACGIAAGLADWLQGEFGASLLLAKQLFEAGQIVTQIALGLVESIPFLGGIASAIVEFAEGAETYTQEMYDYAVGDDFHDLLLCEFYCYWKLHPELSTGAMVAFLDYMKAKFIVLPPQGPLLVIIGQPFAGFLDGGNPATMLRRANFYALEESIDCIDCDCPFDWIVELLEGDGWTTAFIIREGSPAYGQGCYGSYNAAQDRVEGCTPGPGLAVGTWFHVSMPAETIITGVFGKVTWNRTRPVYADSVWSVMSQDGDGEIVHHQDNWVSDGGEGENTFVWEGEINIASGDGKLILGGYTRNNYDGDGSYWRNTRLVVAGTGPNPFEV